MGYAWEPPEKPDWQYLCEAAQVGERFTQEGLQGGKIEQAMREAVEGYTKAHRDFLERSRPVKEYVEGNGDETRLTSSMLM